MTRKGKGLSGGNAGLPDACEIPGFDPASLFDSASKIILPVFFTALLRFGRKIA